jgi:zinc transport system permease protein
MIGYVQALFDPSLPFVRNALVAGLLSAVVFGVTGSVVTVRRIAGLAGAVSHAVLGGIGLAVFLSSRAIVPGLPPMAGALAAAVLAAFAIGAVTLRSKSREDTAINAIWAVGMSVGVLFLAMSPGKVDPMSYLFGNILLVTEVDLWLMGALALALSGMAFAFYRAIEASAFDPEFAKSRGLRTDAIFMATLAAVALSVVLMQTFVGIVMVIAMLVLPAGAASYFSRNLGRMILLSVALSAAYSVAGLALSWAVDLPSGAIIVLIAGVAYALSAIYATLRAKFGLAAPRRGGGAAP